MPNLRVDRDGENPHLPRQGEVAEWSKALAC